MYKVIIIDDEAIVREGIKDLIPWEEEGFSVCAEGKDGRDGLKKVLEFWPDLVLVDIKMPGLTGIELIKEAREQGFLGHFIILTGHSEFEFAKSAISLGVKEYLLKPIDEEELLEIVKSIFEEMEQIKRKKVYHTNNEEIAREELLRKNLLKLESREELTKQLELYHMNLTTNEILCAAVLTDNEMLAGKEDGWAIQIVDEFLGETPGIEKIIMESNIVVIAHGYDYKQFAELLARKNESLYRKYQRRLLISVGHNVTMWYDLSHSYEFARFLLEHEFLFGKNHVLTVDVIAKEQEEVENPSIDYICMLIEVGDLKGIEECVMKFRNYCMNKLMKEMEIKIQIIYNLIEIKNRMDKKHDSETGVENPAVIEKINCVEELDPLLQIYCEILQDMCREIGLDSSGTVIKRLYYYMERNFEKDLKLETVAKMFNYNSNYLGKIFRKEVGDSFNNILDTIRITNAKRLLKESDLKVYQISQQVGYSNIDYFYIKFKKYVGISPKEYRRGEN